MPDPLTLMWTLSGLPNGVEQDISLRAVNAAGSSDVASDSGTPRTVPGAPVLDEVISGDRKLDIAWTEPSDNGGAAISGYHIEVSTDGGATWSTAVANTNSTATTATLGGLTNGVETQVRVTAINEAGEGVPSNVLAETPKTQPAPPTITSITPGNTMLTVAFDPSADDGGSPITRYEYSIDGGATWKVVPKPETGRFNIYGLDNGKPTTVLMRAVNGVNASDPDPQTGTPANVVVTTQPSKPAPGAPSPSGNTPQATATVDGEPTAVTVIDLATERDPALVGQLEITSDGIEIETTSSDNEGDAVASVDNRVPLVPGGTTVLSGSGYKPGTEVNVWLSDRQIPLGTAIVNDDGTFTLTIVVPEDLELGDGTLQINGVATDATSRTVNVGAVVLGQQVRRNETPLAFTGTSIATTVGLGVSLIAVGALLRRRLHDEVASV